MSPSGDTPEPRDTGRAPLSDIDVYRLGAMSVELSERCAKVRGISRRIVNVADGISIDQAKHPFVRELATELDLTRTLINLALRALKDAGVTPDTPASSPLSPPPAGGDRQTPDLSSAVPGPILPGPNPCK